MTYGVSAEDIRNAVLLLLSIKPMTTRELINDTYERSYFYERRLRRMLAKLRKENKISLSSGTPRKWSLNANGQ